MGRESLPPPPPPPVEIYGNNERLSQLPNPPYISSVMVNSGPASNTPPPPPPPPPPLPIASTSLSPPPLPRESRESSAESELPLPPPPPIPEMPPPEERPPPPPPPPPPMPISSPPRDNTPRVLTNGDANQMANSSPPKGSPGINYQPNLVIFIPLFTSYNVIDHIVLCMRKKMFD